MHRNLEDDSDREDGQFIKQVNGLNEGRLGMEDDISDSSPVPSRCRTVAIYVAMTLTASFLTILCPETRLWNGPSRRTTLLHESPLDSDGSHRELNAEVLAELVTILLLIWTALWAVQGSNPGYLDADVVERAFRGVDEEEEEKRLVATGDLDATGSFPPAEEMVELVPAVGGTSTRKRVGSSLPSIDIKSSEGADQATRNRERPFHTSLRRKQCNICTISPPLRSHHCRRCDRCVATFDHHCLFIGTCIGERNHCRFWWFLSFQLLGFCICVNILSSSSFSFGAVSENKERSEQVAALLFVVAKLFVYPLTLLALVMWVTHSWIALSSTTTFECGKAHHLEYMIGTNAGDLPFSNGVDTNIRSFCCLRDSTWHSIAGLSDQQWAPTVWRPPGKIVRDSADWWEHPWENKYWSCC